MFGEPEQRQIVVMVGNESFERGVVSLEPFDGTTEFHLASAFGHLRCIGGCFGGTDSVEAHPAGKFGGIAAWGGSCQHGEPSLGVPTAEQSHCARVDVSQQGFDEGIESCGVQVGECETHQVLLHSEVTHEMETAERDVAKQSSEMGKAATPEEHTHHVSGVKPQLVVG